MGTSGPSSRISTRLFLNHKACTPTSDQSRLHTREDTMFMFLFLLLIQITTVVSNTEKAIFVAPQSSQAPPGHPSLEDFKLETLSLQQLSLRTYIQPEFPTSSSPRGQESWFLLDGLNDGQRYEVRICWAATVGLALPPMDPPSNLTPHRNLPLFVSILMNFPPSSATLNFSLLLRGFLGLLRQIHPIRQDQAPKGRVANILLKAFHQRYFYTSMLQLITIPQIRLSSSIRHQFTLMSSSTRFCTTSCLLLYCPPRGTLSSLPF
jgi:hypothetical protein